MSYEQPDPAGSGDRFRPSDHEGALVRVTVRGVSEFDYGSGPEPVVDCDVDVIEGTGAPQRGTGIKLSNQIMYDQLSKKAPGTRVLGRVLKVGRAYKLEPFQEGDVAKADAFDASPPQTAGGNASAGPETHTAAPNPLAGMSAEQLAQIQALLGGQK